MKKAGVRRIYVVKIFNVAGLAEERLVRAGHPRSAEDFVFRERIEATIATPDDVARLMEDGCFIENADAPDPAPELDNIDFKPPLSDNRQSVDFEFPKGGPLVDAEFDLARQP